MPRAPEAGWTGNANEQEAKKSMEFGRTTLVVCSLRIILNTKAPSSLENNLFTTIKTSASCLSSAVILQFFYDVTNRIKVSNLHLLFQQQSFFCCLKLCLEGSASPTELQLLPLLAFNSRNSPSRYLNRLRLYSCECQLPQNTLRYSSRISKCPLLTKSHLQIINRNHVWRNFRVPG